MANFYHLADFEMCRLSLTQDEAKELITTLTAQLDELAGIKFAVPLTLRMPSKNDVERGNTCCSGPKVEKTLEVRVVLDNKK